MFVNFSDAHFYARKPESREARCQQRAALDPSRSPSASGGDLPKRIVDTSVGGDVRGVSRGKRSPVMTCHAAPGFRHDHRAGGKIPELVGKLDHSVKHSLGDMGEVARG